MAEMQKFRTPLFEVHLPDRTSTERVNCLTGAQINSEINRASQINGVIASEEGLQAFISQSKENSECESKK